MPVWHILYAWKDWCMFSFWSSITSVGGNYPILEHQICVCVYYKQINVVILNIITLWCTIGWPNVKALWQLQMGKRILTHAYPRCVVCEYCSSVLQGLMIEIHRLRLMRTNIILRIVISTFHVLKQIPSINRHNTHTPYQYCLDSKCVLPF